MGKRLPLVRLHLSWCALDCSFNAYEPEGVCIRIYAANGPHRGQCYMVPLCYPSRAWNLFLLLHSFSIFFFVSSRFLSLVLLVLRSFDFSPIYSLSRLYVCSLPSHFHRASQFSLGGWRQRADEDNRERAFDTCFPFRVDDDRWSAYKSFHAPLFNEESTVDTPSARCSFLDLFGLILHFCSFLWVRVQWRQLKASLTIAMLG